MARRTEAAGDRVGWFADKTDMAMASTRLRMMFPIEELTRRGHDVSVVEDADAASDCDTIVFSKAFSRRAVSLAEELARRRTRMVFDICDNVFAGSARPDRRWREARLDRMLALADSVTVSTDTLRDQLVARDPALAERCVVVPDVIPAVPVRADGDLSDGERSELQRLDRFLQRHDGALRCVWFGKSQGLRAGLAHLGRIMPHLRAAQASRPVTLTVISNKRLLYRLFRAGWRGIPVHFVQWQLDMFGAALARHEVALIPVERNDYTLGKTINRPATALLAGIGVIADSLPAYEELRPFIVLDDWEGGLRRFALEPDTLRDRIARGRDAIVRRYDAQVIGDRWEEAIGLPHRGDLGVEREAVP